MPRAQKGQRFGGRQKGVPNKATVERSLMAAEQAAERIRNGKKLAVSVLDEFMHLCAGMAAVYQPLPPNVDEVPEGRAPDWDKFWKCAEMVRDFGKALARHQSPTFKAIAVSGMPTEAPEPRQRFDDPKVTTIDDPVALARVYKLRISRVA